MIAIPVAGLSGVALVGMSMLPTSEESVTMELGSTDARFELVSAPDPSLVQSPTSPFWYQQDQDSHGSPVNVEPDAALADPFALLPDATVVAVRQTDVTVESAAGVTGMTAYEGDVWEPDFEPKYTVTAGRVPAGDGEVMATAAALERLGARLGESVRVLDPARDALVVGVVDAAEHPDSKPLLFGSLGAFTGQPKAAPGDSFFVLDQELDWDAVQRLNQHGAVVWSRSVLLEPPPPGTYQLQDSGAVQGPVVSVIMITAVGAAFAVVEVALLAGAAFVVGARRQQRSLAIVASSGGQRSTLFQIVSAGGLVLGTAGGIMGLGLGIAAGSAFMAFTADGSGTQYWGYHLSFPVLVGVALFAILVGWLSALVPAWAASRIDVVAALRGARRPARPSRHRRWVGFTLLGVGLGLTLAAAAVLATVVSREGFISNVPLFSAAWIAVFAGPVLAQAGAILVAPTLLILASRVLGRLGLGARLATRDAARNPARSVPALAAVMGAVFLGTVVIGYIGSAEARSSETYEHWNARGQVVVELNSWDAAAGRPTVLPIADAVADALKAQLNSSDVRVLSGEESFHLRAPSDVTLVPQLVLPDKFQCEPASQGSSWEDCGTPTYLVTEGLGPRIWAGSVSDLALVLNTPVSEAAQETLQNGGAVALYSEYVRDDGTILLEWRRASDLHEAAMGNDTVIAERSESLSAVVQEPEHSIYFGAFMLAETAKDLGLELVEYRILAALDGPPTDAQLDAARASLRALGGQDLLLRYEAGPSDTIGTTGWAVVAVAALIALAASAVALGLARVEGRRDDATLSSIGASPAVRRNFGFWQAIVIVGLGALIGGLLGLSPTAATGLTGAMPFAAPPLQVVAIVIALPLFIAACSWLFTGRVRSPSRRPTD